MRLAAHHAQFLAKDERRLKKKRIKGLKSALAHQLRLHGIRKGAHSTKWKEHLRIKSEGGDFPSDKGKERERERERQNDQNESDQDEWSEVSSDIDQIHASSSES